MSRSRLFGLVLGLSIATAPGLSTGQSIDPCEGPLKGVFLLGNLLDISLTSNELQLLNGREDPKLKRHLEWRLVSAAAEARRHIDEGATVERNMAIPNLASGVERATAYITEHDLDSKPPVPAAKRVANPLANLKVVEKWLSKQP